jgi:hypothetical protein
MYANIDNPPLKKTHMDMPFIYSTDHRYRVSQLDGILVLIENANKRFRYSYEQYRDYSLAASPFTCRETWMTIAHKWYYIIRRLERYYLKKLCALNSMAYEQLKDSVHNDVVQMPYSALKR